MHINDSYFLASLLVLGIGPLLYQLARVAGSALAVLDGFAFVAISGLVLLHLIPDSVALAGWSAIAVGLVGLFAPSFVEHRLQRLARPAHTVALVLALLGIGLHGFMDGMALIEPDGHQEMGDGHHMLPMAVVLHRLPVGLTVWFLLRPIYGSAMAVGAMALVGVATGVGYSAGEAVSGSMDSGGWGLFQALVSGSLLHVILHRAYPVEARGGGRLQSGLGALGGLALLWSLGTGHQGGQSIEEAGAVFYRLALESAPALLLAYGGAGLLYGFVPQASFGWMKRGGGLGQALRGLGFGLPLPICSCGVVPAYRSLIRQGVPATAGMAFLVATPELSLDAVLVTLPLLGGEFTVARVICAAIVALVVGWGLGRLVPTISAAGADLGDGADHQGRWRGFLAGLEEVVDSTAPWIILGLALAALATPLLQAPWLADLPDGVDVLGLALLGMPAYVCASGATPLAAVLIFKGVSPGAALAFLLTGPATNITTFGVLSQLHGRRYALFFAALIAVLAVGLGLGVNQVLPAGVVTGWSEVGVEEDSLLKELCLAGLALLFVISLLRRGPRNFVGELFDSGEEGHEDHDHHDHEHDCCDGAPHTHSTCDH